MASNGNELAKQSTFKGECMDYPRSKVCNPQQKSEYMVEAYSEYPSVTTQDDYIQTEDLSNQGVFYSVSQRVAGINQSYSASCTNDDQVNYSEWAEKDRATSTSETGKESLSEIQSDKCSKDTTTASVSSTLTNTASGSPEPLQGIIIPTCVYMHNHTAILMDIEDTPTATSELICQAIVNCEELGLNKQQSNQIFSLWMCSSLLELQLKPTHKPYEIKRCWQSLLKQYSHVSVTRQQRDEPMISFQRNVFFPQHLEEKIKDQKVLELLYEEARHNILEGRYPCEVAHYIMLGGIQARMELGAYNPQLHSTHYFREEQSKYLPAHVRKSPTWTWLPISSKNSAEVRLLEQYKRIPVSATNRKLMRKYLEFCWSLPFYGSAFFEGQVEQPVHGLTSLITQQDIPVLVGINSKGVYVIDDLSCTLLLGLKYEEFSWDYARPSREDPNCLPCLFLQFLVVENGARVSKILQVFSRQASLMDTLISGFVNHIKSKSADELDRQYGAGDGDAHAQMTMSSASYMAGSFPSLANKLSRLTLATFDEDGRCIGQMGSWSFSY